MKAGVLLVSLLAVAAAEAAQRQKTEKPPEKLAAEMLDALGGKAFLNVHDIQTSGRYFNFDGGSVTGGDVFAGYIRLPNEERMEIGSPKYRTITINSGNAGWTIDGNGAAEQGSDQIESFTASFLTSFQYVTRFVLNDSDATLQTLPTETVDAKRAEVLEIRDASKNRIRFYIDQETHLPLKMQVRFSGDTLVRDEVFANWHPFAGVMTPLFVARYRDGVRTMETRIEGVRYNTNLADNLFAP